MLERGFEQFLLMGWFYVRDNNDHSRMQKLFPVKAKKVATIVGYEGVVPFANHGHELPIFRTAKTHIDNVIRQVPRLMRQPHQGSVQALIDQKLHC